MKKNVLLLGAMLFACFLNAQVGVGTSTPNSSAALEVSSANKGFLPPRINLLSETDATTIPNPAKGLIVYYPGTGLNGEGNYVNIGTTTAPKWSLLLMSNSTSGANTSKMSYTGEPDLNNTVKAKNLEFRIRNDAAAGIIYFEVRRTTPPTVSTTYSCNRSSWYNNSNPSYPTGRVTVVQKTVTLTPANWNTWQVVDTAGTGIASTVFSFLTYISSIEDNTFYVAQTNARYGNDIPSNQKFWNVAVMAY